ncbi:MAG: hypothetical protein AB8G11_22820 [Saprospiraceae bacterium]
MKIVKNEICYDGIWYLFKEENKHDTRINHINPFFEGVCDFSDFNYEIIIDLY